VFQSELKTEVATSWEQLCGLLFADSWQPSLGRFRSHFAYKGLGCAEYALSTSLMRLGGEFGSVERHLLRNFRKYAQRDAAGDSFWNWLGLAQHHGLPTRLLDWTYSPLVALHFATVSESGDCAVWAVDFVRAHELLPANLREALEQEGSDVWTVEMLDNHLPDWESLEALGRERDFLLFIEPPSLDQRIVNQYALFSVLTTARHGLDDWVAEHPSLARKIVIPAALRWEVRDKLDQANVNERVLFPGLDGLCDWLHRHYSPGHFDSEWKDESLSGRPSRFARE
jgi:hypothetical protein